MTAPERAKAIAAMLASDHDGEVLNAARALVRFAASLGLKVQDLVIVTEKISPQPQPRQDQPRRPFDGAAYEAYRRQSAAQAANGSTFTTPDIERMIDEIRRHQRNRSAWFRSAKS